MLLLLVAWSWSCLCCWCGADLVVWCVITLRGAQCTRGTLRGVTSGKGGQQATYYLVGAAGLQLICCKIRPEVVLLLLLLLLLCYVSLQARAGPTMLQADTGARRKRRGARTADSNTECSRDITKLDRIDTLQGLSAGPTLLTAASNCTGSLASTWLQRLC